ncbi:hypothetical protein C5167_003727 [Papaver somniferum]|uniref:Uncharacterized protein n=1 Tax=Papaver somniferum TaxID=3469 RepID=A0A4Y7L5F1_PAPSO|nr:uncharacterized protein LOC113307944 [Papaver somniferum]XP_026412201.1 uncharacterized protein LOC113307944 [Papaver somniferum]RZC79499.1 hypothetical protein C5167_003727 [Papaver somniferum]
MDQGLPVAEDLVIDPIDQGVDDITFHGRIGNRCVTTRALTLRDAATQNAIPHPYILAAMGISGMFGNGIRHSMYECFDETLATWGRCLTTTSGQPKAMFIDILSQSLFAVDGIRGSFNGCAHGYLNARNICLQFLPHKHPSTIIGDEAYSKDYSYTTAEVGPKIVVKLRDFDVTREGNSDTYLKDLQAFGRNVIKPFMIVGTDKGPKILCEEAYDLLKKIFQTPWEGD